MARGASSCISLLAASFYLVVAFDNITNPDSNWVYVKGVMSLDGVPAGSGFGWRAIHASPVFAIAYVGVICGEVFAGALMGFGGFKGWQDKGHHDDWLGAQRATLLGGMIGLGVFFFGFIVVGGNWFVMYLNQKWNGLEPAFQTSVLTLLSLIVVLQVAAGGRSRSSRSSQESPGKMPGARPRGRTSSNKSNTRTRVESKPVMQPKEPKTGTDEIITAEDIWDD